MTHLLAISPDVIGTRMAGVGIRSWHLAAAAARQGIEVTLAVPGACDLSGEGFAIVTYGPAGADTLRAAASAADVVLAGGYLLHDFPFLRQLDRPLVVDVYDPFIIENLHFHAARPLDEQGTIHRSDLAVLNRQLQAGDFFLCASEKQRDYCLGLLMANNRVNPYTWGDDPTLRRLIDVLPFGLAPHPPQAGTGTGGTLKGHWPGIAAGDQLILWGGGVWEWLDPLTAIRAMPQVTAACPRARLFFIGTRHPNADLPASRMAAAAIALARELDLIDRCVFFRDWTPYAEREALLLEADVGISLHVDHLETRFSFRTRLLDYIWAGLPIVTSGGDELGEMVAREGLGVVVDFGDVAGTAAALIELLTAPDARAARAPAFARAADRFSWDRTVAPLIDFCRAPRMAADKGHEAGMLPGLADPPPPTPLWRLPARAWQIVSRRGAVGLWREAVSYVRWSIKRRA